MPATAGQFHLLEPLGHGTLGELFRARDLDVGRTVAFRRIAPGIIREPEQLNAVLEVCRRVSELAHPAIAAVYASERDAAGAFIATEFVPGTALSALVIGTPLHPRRALDLAVQVADGLAAAHAADLVHGALSTSSVIVTPRDGVKLLDVGLVDWTAAGSRPRRGDLADLGAVLFEMLVGRPIKRGWPAELRLKEIPAPVQPVLQQLLSTNPREQFASMVVAAAALREARQLMASGLDERPDEPPTIAHGGRTRAVIVAAVVLLAGLGAWIWGR